MSYTYDVSTDRGKVRRDIGDSVAGEMHFDDDEIDSFLTEGGGVKAAAGLALMAWAAALSREDKTTKAGSWQGERGNVVTEMKALAQEYFALAGYTPAASVPTFRQANIDWTAHVAAEREYNEDNV